MATTNRGKVNLKSFNASADLPFELRLEDFQVAMQDVYDFFHAYPVDTPK